MAFLELAFNLPKSNRVVTFDNLSKVCGIPQDHVEFMVMKTMALGLVRGSIDQIRQEVTISWVAPKVLEAERISTMLSKFEEW
jgi:26S proteasome regulatory subunit N9